MTMLPAPGVSIPLLQINNLSVNLLHVEQGWKTLLHSLHLELEEGKNHLLIGASGSGKTTLAKAILQLLPAGRFSLSGAVLFEGQDLLSLSEGQITAIRGRGIGLMLQDSSAALNPLLQVGTQIAEGMVEHGLCNWQQALARAKESLEQLGFQDPEWICRSKPARLSGGMKQRVCLAMVLLLSPRLLILDEPTANLDSETKQEVLTAVDIVQSHTGCSLLWLTHDREVMRHLWDSVTFHLDDGCITRLE